MPTFMNQPLFEDSIPGHNASYYADYGIIVLRCDRAWRQKTSSERSKKTKLIRSTNRRPDSIYCLLRVWQLGSMEIETSPQTLFIVCFAFLLFNSWDRESVCVKVLMLVFGCLYLSDLRNRAVVECERCQDECTHTKLLLRAIYNFLDMS